MASFSYRALQPNGLFAEGKIEANGRAEALRLLGGKGLRPVALSQVASAGPAPSAPRPARARGVSRKALEMFTRQLAGLLSASVPLARALKLLSSETSEAGPRDEWRAIHDMVIDGTGLAGAMGERPKTFPRVYVAMVRAGETGGFLDLVLNQIADFQSGERELRSKVFAALAYPSVLGVLSIGVLIFLLVFFIPRFEGLFSDFGAALPVLTQIIVRISRLAQRYGVFVLLAVAAGAVFLRNRLRTEEGRRQWEHLVLRMPVLGPLNARFAMARFCRMLGTLTGAGVPLIQALRVARESIGNQILADAVTTAIERVQQGDRLGTSLGECRELFSPSVVEMISVAEQSGNLDKELVRLAGSTESELDRMLKAAVSLAEPIMLFFMAGIVGLIVIGMVLPIFTLQEYIR